MRKVLVCLLLLFCFIFLPNPSFAVTVTITNYPSTITDDVFTLTASVSGATTGTNYLKIDIAKEGTTDYFGETFNGTDWYGGSTYSQYFPISIQSGTSWIGQVQGRTGSPTISQYDGTGTYKIRLRRYTSGGGYTTSEANNSAVFVSISLPTATPTSTPPPVTPTNTLVPTVAKASIPTPTKTVTSIPTTSTIAIASSSAQEILGGSSVADTESITKPPSQIKVLSSRFNKLPFLFIVLGGAMILVCGILLYFKIRREIGLFQKDE